jgi:regulatory protein
MSFEAQPAVEAHPEDEVPPEDEKALGPPGDPETVARTICLRLLDQRARTRAELADALRRKGVPDEPAAVVLDRFAEVGLIDDEALAGTFALAQHRERGLARRAVAVKLRRRGLDEQVVAAALDPIDRDSEYAAARTLVARKLRSLGGLDPQVQARRLVGLLGRRGYPAGLAHEVVREALAGVLADTSTLDDAYDAAADLT